MELFYTSISGEAIRLVNEVLKTGFLNQGKYTDQFEALLKERFRLPNVLTVNSCTSALQFALLSAGVKPGDEVILPPQTFVATGLVILMVGGTPIFADVDVNGNLCPHSVREKITDRTRAIMAVHWGGIPCQIKKLNEIANTHGVVVVEDAAHALGARVGEQFVGEISAFTAFSFQSIKMLSEGDGGALAFHDGNLASRIRKLRWFGMDKASLSRSELGDRDCDIKELGFKGNTNDVASALGLGNLYGFDRRIAARRKNAARYYAGLSTVDGIKLPEIISIREPSFWLFTLRVKDRLNFVRKLASHGIPSSVVDRRIDRHSVFGGLTPGLVGQESFEEEQVSIPVHEALRSEDIERVINTIKEGW